MDDAIAKKATSEASLLSAKAAVRSAQLDVDFCTIAAPVDGRVSRTEITKGNLVQIGTKLTRVTSLHPIYATWDVDENVSLWYREDVAAGQVHRRPAEDAAEVLRPTQERDELPARRRHRLHRPGDRAPRPAPG